MTTPTLSAYLPVLTHPEHGEAICRAAGFVLRKGQVWKLHSVLGYGLVPPSATMVADEIAPLEVHVIAAISHGIAAWLAERNISGLLIWQSHEWNISEGPVDTESGDLLGWGPDLPAALLAAAERVLGIENA